MAPILIHPALAADYRATQALAERLGLAVAVEAGKPATLVPEAELWDIPAHLLPMGGDAA